MAKPGVMPSDCIPDKCGVILCKVSTEKLVFLKQIHSGYGSQNSVKPPLFNFQDAVLTPIYNCIHIFISLRS